MYEREKLLEIGTNTFLLDNKEKQQQQQKKNVRKLCNSVAGRKKGGKN